MIIKCVNLCSFAKCDICGSAQWFQFVLSGWQEESNLIRLEISMAQKESEYEFEETMVTLSDENGEEKDFYIDEIYDVDGKTYAAAIPADVEEITEYFVFRLKPLGNDDFEMEDITEEEEYDAAADAYEELLDTRAWNRIFENDKDES